MPPTPSSPFESTKLGPITLRNRFVKAATNEGMAKDGVVTKGLALFHERMAQGGVGLSTVAYCATSKDGRTFVDQATLDKDSLKDFRALTDGVHRHGAAASAQITHAGSFTFLPHEELSISKPLSSSGGFNKVGIMTKRYFKKAMTRDDMDAMSQEFVDAAIRAREAGFDAVELHMGHGYLLSQFVSPIYNKRNDDYGGSIEKRVKFPNEVLSRVLDAVGNDLAVIVKYSMTDGKKGGNTADDGLAVARSIEKAGAHLAVLSNGLNVESITAMFGSPLPKTNSKITNPIIKFGMLIQGLTAPPDIEFKENYLRETALQIRRGASMPLSYLGGVHSFDNVTQAFDDGFDFVAIGRVLIHDPDIINKWKAETANVSGCTACNRCVSMMYLPEGTHCVLAQPQEAHLNQIPAGD